MPRMVTDSKRKRAVWSIKLPVEHDYAQCLLETKGGRYQINNPPLETTWPLSGENYKVQRPTRSLGTESPSQLGQPGDVHADRATGGTHAQALPWEPSASTAASNASLLLKACPCVQAATKAGSPRAAREPCSLAVQSSRSSGSSASRKSG